MSDIVDDLASIKWFEKLAFDIECEQPWPFKQHGYE